MEGIPPVRASDNEDVIWALETAESLWKRNARVDAIVWVRRAAREAAEAGDSERARALETDAATLTEAMAAQVRPQDSRIPPPVTGPPPAQDDIDALLAGDAEPETLELEAINDSDLLSIPPEDPRPVAPPPVARPAPPPLRPMAPPTPMMVPLQHLAPRPPAPPPAPPAPPPPAPPPRHMAPPTPMPEPLVPRHLAPPTPMPEPLVARHLAPPTPMPEPIVPRHLAPPTPMPEPIVPRHLAPPTPMPEGPRHMAPPTPMPPTPPTPLPATPLPPSPMPEPPRAASPTQGHVGTDAHLRPQQPRLSPPTQLLFPTAPPPIPAVTAPPRHLAPPTPPTVPKGPKVLAPAIPPLRPMAPPTPWPPPQYPPKPAPAPDPISQRETVSVVPATADLDAARRDFSELDSEGVTRMGEGAISPMDLADVRELAKASEDQRERLINRATVLLCATGVDLPPFAFALVLEGEIHGTDAGGRLIAKADQGAIVRTRGTLNIPIGARFRTAQDDTTLALWSEAGLRAALTGSDVDDELRCVGDRWLARAEVLRSPLASRLHADVMGRLLDRMAARAHPPDSDIIAAGSPVGGMLLVGYGAVSTVEPGSRVLGPGEFIFPEAALSAGRARATVRANDDGAVILTADRRTTQELFATEPLLLELLAS